MASIFDLCTKQGTTPETQNFVLIAGDRAYWTDRLVLCATEAPEGLKGPAERWYNRDAVGVQVPWTIVNKKRYEELIAEHSKPESISGDLPVASIEGLAPLWDFVSYTSISAYTNGGENVCCAIDTIEDFAYFGPEILRTFLKACKALKIDTCSVYFRGPSKALEGARVAMLRGHNSETNSVVIAQGCIPRGTPKGAECFSDKLGAIVLNACPDHIGVEYFGDADCEKPRQEGESYTEFLKRYALEGVHEQKEIDKVNKMYNRIAKYNVI